MQKSRRSKTFELYAVLLIMAFTACAPSGEASRSAGESENGEPQKITENSFDNPSTHTPRTPDRDQAVTHSRVFVDAAWLTEHESRLFVHITGQLPTPCHRLFEPEVTVSDDKITIEMSSWQAEGVICMQVLQPFVYLHEITGLNRPDGISMFVNGTPLSEAP